jgi:hypothetical protein
VTSGANITYFVRASTPGGNSDSNAASITAATCPSQPASPSLAGSPICAGANAPAVRLTWNAINGVSTYTIFREGASIGQTSATTYDDTTAPPGRAYLYYVRAQNSTGYADSNSVSVAVSTLACPAQFPDFNVTFVAPGKTSVMPGDSISLAASISNVGNADSTPTSAVVRIGSGPIMNAGDVTIGTLSVPVIPVGASTTVTQNVAIPSITAGTYYLFVSADDAHVTGDPNLTNSVGRSAALTVGGASVCTVSCAASIQGKLTAQQSVFFAPAQASSCPATYRWVFGDGTTSTAQSPSHAYQLPGAYQWTLSITAGPSTCESSGTIVIAAPAASRRRAASH